MTATYGFLSVLRRGIAALVPPTATGQTRVEVPLGFTIAGSAPGSRPSVQLYGPGDVATFDVRSLRRIWPAANADNAEPNYFPLVEFAEGDLPWRYTPAAPSGDRLLPWLCLVVLAEGEVASFVPAGDRFAVLSLDDATALPDLTQSWAWAHAQVVGPPAGTATDFDAAAVADLLAADPARVSSRLLCPRRLDRNTRYLACVVPAFELGRRAGLNQSADGTSRLAPAWTPTSKAITLPVYFSWRFATGDEGDFASLAARLHAERDLPDAVWRRDLAVSPPGVVPPHWQTIGLEGALRTLDASSPSWSSIDTGGFTARLLDHVNAGGATLAPPLYGRWLAAASQLSIDAHAVPPWFHQLNADPRARVAAGLGTLVVQTGQDALLAAAWAQVDGIRRVNDRLRWFQFARELSLSLYTRHFAIAEDGFWQLTSPVHGRVRVSAAAPAPPATVAQHLTASPIVDGALAPGYRRAMRPLGSLGVRQRRPAKPVSTALAHMNTGAIAVVPLAPASTPNQTAAVRRLGHLAVAFSKSDVTPERLGHKPLPSGFVLRTTVAATPATVTAFVAASDALMTQLARPLPPGPELVEVDLGGLRARVLEAVHPKNTIEAVVRSRLTGVRTGPTRTDPIEPVMAAPEFPQPMYEPLRDLSQSWLIPGLDQVKPDTVAVLTTNWAFVESFMVGLNHEMARKLLWNGYPTDQRGTYFRHFWDIRSRTDGSSDGEFGPMHVWTAALGGNRQRPTDPLVLLVRGELIRRYPNIVVSAMPAALTPAGRRPGAPEQHPIFYGRLEPDVALFAFDIAPAAARGTPGFYFALQEHPSEPRFGLAAPTGVFAATPANWSALAWDAIAADAAALGAIRYINLNASLPHDPATADPTGAVWHGAEARAADLAHITLRHPKRLVIHSSMLIPGGGTP